MSEYIQITNDYLQKLHDDSICQEYFKQKELVATQYPELKVQIDEFRRRNFKLQMRRIRIDFLMKLITLKGNMKIFGKIRS